MEIPPEEGYYDVVLHGTPEYTLFFGERIDHLTLGKIILGRKDYDGRMIRLLSCNTGADTTDGKPCFAQRLADYLETEVKAPNDLLYVYANGRTKVGIHGKGRFISYKPRKK